MHFEHSPPVCTRACEPADTATDPAQLGETGVLSPIAVVPGDDGKGWFVIDGIGRMNALLDAGVTETEAQVFDLGDLSVAESRGNSRSASSGLFP